MKHFKKLAWSTTCAIALTAGLSSAPDRASAGPEPMLGEIMIVGFSFCPRGWAPAEGQILPINQNQSLYSLLGTTFGGDGRTTFALPDYRGRVIVGQGNGPGLTPRQEGQRGGAVTHVMTESTMPSHSHRVNANNLDGDKAGPGNKLLAAAPTGGTGNETIYSLAAPNKTMSSEMIANAGSSAPISTIDPTLGLMHCIALQGLFPSRN